MIELRELGKTVAMIVDGVVAAKDEYRIGPLPSFCIENTPIRDRILSHRIEEFPAGIGKIWFSYENDGVALLHSAGIEFESRDLELELRFDWENWSQPWTIAEYGDALLDCGQQMWERGFTVEQDDEESVSNGFSLHFQLPAAGRINDWLLECCAIARELCGAAETKLRKDKLSDSLLLQLDIPQQFRGPCEQYLIYFADFLKDLGVESSVGITHRGGATLLAVTPINRSDALERIRCALDAYLALPSLVDAAESFTTDPVLQQLSANIMHLRAQLVLRDATIEAKNASLAAERQMYSFLNLSTMVQRPPSVDGTRDEEKVLGGVVTFKTAETKLGVSVSLAEIVRRLKRLFKE